MSITKGKEYEIDGEKYSFSFQNGKLIGATKSPTNNSGRSSGIKLDSPVFQSDEAKANIINSYNEVVHKGNKNSYLGSDDFSRVQQSTDAEKEVFFQTNKSKLNNEQYVDNPQTDPLAAQDQERFYSYFGYNNNYKPSDIMKYPQDMDVNQDHFKIMKYNYQRKDLNASKPRYQETQTQTLDDGTEVERTVSVAGDSVVGSKLMGSVLLPMPKVTDVNGVEWGKSELTISGLAAIGAVDKLTGGGRLAGKSEAEKENDKNIKAELEEL